jgi:hypothetical protein
MNLAALMSTIHSYHSSSKPSYPEGGPFAFDTGSPQYISTEGDGRHRNPLMNAMLCDNGAKRAIKNNGWRQINYSNF